MNAKKVHELSNQELEAKLNELKKELFNLRMSHSTKSLANPLALHNCKKDIARVKTVIRERQLSAAAGK